MNEVANLVLKERKIPSNSTHLADLELGEIILRRAQDYNFGGGQLEDLNKLDNVFKSDLSEELKKAVIESFKYPVPPTRSGLPDRGLLPDLLMN